MDNNEYLGMNPLEALQIKPVALQGGGGGVMEQGNPTMDLAKQLGTGYLTTQFGPMGTAAGTAIGSMFYGGTTNVPQGYADGTESVPGQRTGEDTVPAMLSPGEAVIPASAAQDPANQEAIQGMVQEGQQDQGMASQILQSLGLPLDPQLIAMIEDMLAQGVPPEQIVQQLQERMQGGQEAPPQEGMQEGMGMPQGLYNGTTGVHQSPLSGKGQREQRKFQADESRKDAAFQADQARKDDAHSESMKQKSESAMYARSMSGE